MKRLWTALLDALFPRKCACCRTLTGGAGLCEVCAQGLRTLEHPWQIPAQIGEAGRAAAVFSYSGTGAALIKGFKFGRRFACYDPLKAPFEARMCDLLAHEAIDWVVPAPMLRAAQNSRGFNQAEEIARGLCKALGLPLRTDLLLKTRENRRQHHLSAAERAQNVAEVYEARHPEVLRGKTVLLVDDIVTTGATLAACARVLYGAGARRVICAAVLATPVSSDQCGGDLNHVGHAAPPHPAEYS